MPYFQIEANAKLKAMRLVYKDPNLPGDIIVPFDTLEEAEEWANEMLSVVQRLRAGVPTAGEA